jgi:hypothetical protein
MNTDKKKAEKLVAAIYMLTSFFDVKEPMKWRLRELGNQLLSFSGEPRNIVLEIISLLSVGKNANLISDMNFEIIHREFSSLVSQSIALEDIFEKPFLREAYSPEETQQSVQKKVFEKAPEKHSLYVASSVSSAPSAPIIRDKPYTHTEQEKKDLKEFGAVAVKKNSRQSVIIGLLKRKKEIMIKDVSPLIDGVSEKTIQRELLAMVSQKILKKEGEKRWSRYSLAD